jgi:hypothetical protein
VFDEVAGRVVEGRILLSTNGATWSGKKDLTVRCGGRTTGQDRTEKKGRKGRKR